MICADSKHPRKWHYADANKSERLRIVAGFLTERGSSGATSFELAAQCFVVNPAGAVSELRANGYSIKTEYICNTFSGRRIYRYTLASQT